VPRRAPCASRLDPPMNVVWYEFMPSLTYMYCHDVHLATFSDESNRSRTAIVMAAYVCTDV